MSHDIHLRCVSHDPYIQSEAVGHYTDSLAEIRRSIRNREIIAENMEALDDDRWEIHHNDVAKRELWFFLWRHRHCDLEIWSEYGDQYSLEEGPTIEPIAADTILGRATKFSITDKGVIVEFTDLTPEGNRLLKRIQQDNIQHLSIGPMNVGEEVNERPELEMR